MHLRLSLWLSMFLMPLISLLQRGIGAEAAQSHDKHAYADEENEDGMMYDSGIVIPDGNAEYGDKQSTPAEQSEAEEMGEKVAVRSVPWDRKEEADQWEWDNYVLENNVPAGILEILPRMVSHVNYNARGKVVGYEMQHYSVPDLNMLTFKELSQLNYAEKQEFFEVTALEARHTGDLYKSPSNGCHLVAIQGRRIVGYAVFFKPNARVAEREGGGLHPGAYFRAFFVHATASYVRSDQLPGIEAQLAQALLLYIKQLVAGGRGVGLLCYAHQENCQLVGKLERALKALHVAGKIARHIEFQQGVQERSPDKHYRFVDFLLPTTQQN